jgi:hypothetical protein
VRFGGPTVGKTYDYYQASIHNLTTALVKRCILQKQQGGYGPPLKPKGTALKEWKSTATRLKIGSRPPLEIEDFLALYTGRQRSIYTVAATNLQAGELKLSSRDRIVTIFMKYEKLEVKENGMSEPRVIYCRSPEFRVLFGTYVRSYEHDLYTSLAYLAHPSGEKVVYKGMTTFQLGKLVERKYTRIDDCVIVGLDASRFDQSFSRPLLKAVNKIHRRCTRFETLPVREMHNLLLSSKLDNRLRGRAPGGKVRVDRINCKMSGDNDTSLDAALVTVVGVVTYMTKIRIPPSDYALMDNGDDLVIMITRKRLGVLAGLSDWFRDLGFIMVTEQPVDVLEQMEFCQMHPVFDGTAWRMVRNLTCIDKDLTCSKHLPNWRVAKRWLTSVGQCGLALNYGMPILQDFYSRLIFEDAKPLTNDMCMRSGLFRMAEGLQPRTAQITPEARASFYAAFGITPTHQLAIEEQLKTWRPTWGGGFACDHLKGLWG